VVIGLIAASLAHAATVPTLPGRALVLPRCRPDPSAACWESAPVADRFAEVPALGGETREATVRLAWNKAGILVRVDTALSDTEAIEISVSKKATEKLATAWSGRFTAGVEILPARGLAPGSCGPWWWGALVG